MRKDYGTYTVSVEPNKKNGVFTVGFGRKQVGILLSGTGDSSQVHEENDEESETEE